jgi:hypothetical protein
MLEAMERDRARAAADPPGPPGWNFARVYERAGFKVLPPASPDGRYDWAHELTHRHRVGIVPPPTVAEAAEIRRWARDNEVAAPAGPAGAKVRALESARIDAILDRVRQGRGWCAAPLVLDHGGHVWGLACHPGNQPTAAELAEIAWFASRAEFLWVVDFVIAGNPSPRVLFVMAGSPEAEAAFRRAAAGGYQP